MKWATYSTRLAVSSMTISQFYFTHTHTQNIYKPHFQFSSIFVFHYRCLHYTKRKNGSLNIVDRCEAWPSDRNRSLGFVIEEEDKIYWQLLVNVRVQISDVARDRRVDDVALRKPFLPTTWCFISDSDATCLSWGWSKQSFTKGKFLVLAATPLVSALAF